MGFLWAECRKSAEIPAAHLFCEKNRKIRVDKTNRLWYSVLATRLDKSNHVAPEKRKPLQGLLRKPDPPWQSCGAVSGDPQVCRGEATPSCLRKTALWLKSPTGAFIAAQTPIPPFHSLFQVSCGFSLLPRLDARHSVCLVPHRVQKKNKNGTCSLTTCVPRFLFLTPSVMADTMPAPSKREPLAVRKTLRFCQSLSH